MRTSFQIRKLADPIFLLSLFILLLNDFYLKYHFPGLISGKLSDFAGLFLFPYLLSVFQNRNVSINYILTCLFFIYWKSPLSNNFILFLNSIYDGFERTIDNSDLLALLILPFSYFRFKKQIYFKSLFLKLRWATLAISVFSCFATSRARQFPVIFYDVDKVYSFNTPLIKLASYFNDVQLEQISSNRYSRVLCFDSNHSAFYYKWDSGRIDTVAKLIDINAISNSDTISISTSLANISFNAKGEQSEIKLISICGNGYPGYNDTLTAQSKINAISIFEKNIIKPINKKIKKDR